MPFSSACSTCGSSLEPREQRKLNEIAALSIHDFALLSSLLHNIQRVSIVRAVDQNGVGTEAELTILYEHLTSSVDVYGQPIQ